MVDMFVSFGVCVFIARLCVPWAPQVTWILWWTLLDHVEAAHVWLHWCSSGVEGAWGGQEGIPQSIHPYHRIRQRSPSAVHQFHCLQAPRLLNLKFTKGICSPFFLCLGYRFVWILLRHCKNLYISHLSCFFLLRNVILCFWFLFSEFQMQMNGWELMNKWFGLFPSY